MGCFFARKMTQRKKYSLPFIILAHIMSIVLQHCAREASMSMLMKLSWAFVPMKASWACSWSSHAHVRVKASRARPQLDNMRPASSILRSPVGSMEGPRLVSDPMGVSSCVLRVPWYGFCCLECKNIADIANFLCGADLPPPAWLRILKRQPGEG